MKIAFIQTGGTIDKEYPKGANGYAFEITEAGAARILKEVNPNFSYEIIELMRKDSLDITEEERQIIKECCEKTEADKIIITHGTDTMIQTAKLLKTVKNKTIVLTGASRPEIFKNSDASFNVGTAVGIVSVLTEGVYIAMSGRVYSPDNCKKDAVTGQFVEINK